MTAPIYPFSSALLLGHLRALLELLDRDSATRSPLLAADHDLATSTASEKLQQLCRELDFYPHRIPGSCSPRPRTFDAVVADAEDQDEDLPPRMCWTR